ncbi:MAG: TasA family protein, partial [Acidimicrobiaceae bacterium]
MRKNTSLTSHIGRLLLSLSTLAVAGAGIATAASGAMFTDTEDSTMDVSSGWVDVALGGPTVVALANLKPGDVFFRPINVANAGSLDFSYTLTASRPTGTGAPLVDALQVETWKTTTAGDCAAATYQTGTQVGSASSLTALSMANAN